MCQTEVCLQPRINDLLRADAVVRLNHFKLLVSQICQFLTLRLYEFAEDFCFTHHPLSQSFD